MSNMDVVWLMLFFFYFARADRGLHQKCITPHGEIGRCIEIFSCRHLYLKAIRQPNRITVRKYLQHSLCGTRKGVKLVCCGERKKVNVHEECGIVDDDIARIYGGVVKMDHFPWMAALQYKRDENNKENLDFRCAGFLINSQFVLTAAHCLRYKLIDSVHLGISNLTNYETQNEHVKAEIVNITYHENYRGALDDIGLIRIKPVNYTLNIRWICLPKKNSRLPDLFTIRGWGRNDRMVQTFTTVIESRLMNNDYDDCPLAMRKKLRSSCIICAGGEINMDSCEGDSGGALLANVRPIGWIAYGIVSFGVRDCSRGDPAIYTRIQCYSRWIEDKMLELLEQN